MKVLSIRQPWAGLILTAGKLIENRTWTTKYRGPLAIHAGLTVDRTDMAYYRTACRAAGIDLIIDTGGIVGIVDLVDVVTSSDNQWFDGPYGWVLANPRPIQFVPCAGRLGLFEIKIEEIKNG